MSDPPRYPTHIDPETGIGTLQIIGAFDVDLFKQGVMRLWQDQSFCWRTLFDAREGDLSQLDAPTIRRLSKELDKVRSEFPAGRGAYLVARDIDFGVARMTEVFADTLPIEARTFKDYDRAWAWLLEGLEG